MSMRDTRRDVMELFNGPTLSVLATVNAAGRPWSRYVMSRIDDDMTIRIPTKSTTRKVEDIELCPFVHLLVGRNLFGRDGAYAQIEGRAVISRDYDALRRFWHDSFRRYFSDPADPSYVLIEIRPERIEYWSLMANENPAVLEEDDLYPKGISWDEEYWMSESGVVPVGDSAK